MKQETESGTSSGGGSTRRVMVELPTLLHQAFKQKCVGDEVTMSEQIKGWVEKYVGTKAGRNGKRGTK